MQTNSNNVWWPRTVTFLVAAAAGLSATFWVLKGGGAGAPANAPPALLSAGSATIDSQVVALALGGGKVAATPEAAPLSSRFQLTGVVADPSHSGAALIAVDGKPPRAYRVGATVDGTLVLQSVAARRAVLGADATGPATVTLDLPTLSK
ncbi:MAG: type II secretion system protein N [Burkholderiales bacterium]